MDQKSSSLSKQLSSLHTQPWLVSLLKQCRLLLLFSGIQKASSTVLAYANGYSTLESDSTNMLGGNGSEGALGQDMVGGCEAVE